MPADIQEAILDLCVEFNSLAAQAYRRFSEAERDETVKAKWRLLEADETTHLGYWRMLIKRQREGVIPAMFDDPEGVRRGLESAKLRIVERLEAMREPADTQEMLSIACSMEFAFLDQTLLQLLKYIKILSGRKDPFREYHEHLVRFLKTVDAHGSSPELKLIGETISRLWADNRKLLDSSFIDPLTSILNRRGFFKSIIPLANLARRKGTSIGIVLIDVDDFKRINDAYGHKAGDEILTLVADTIRKGFRGSDVPARYGGDEFIVFLSEAEPKSLQAIGEKIRRRVEKFSAAVEVTVSIGISHAVAERSDDTERWLDALIARADESLYRAKNTGRNTVMVSN
jgi:diguanylate cyclase (GGDEF)-like protein